jgi:hypothetical protein
LPFFTALVKAFHVLSVNVSADSPVFLESRTDTIAGKLPATSTQLVAPPL